MTDRPDSGAGLSIPDQAAVERDGAATARDAIASLRDVAATTRDDVLVVGVPDQRAAADRLSAAADRAASALDRLAAAVDRTGSAHELQNAYQDRLTGALLRDAGRDQLARDVERARRTSDTMTLAFLDVDQLKRVNDERGHASGDHVLRLVGEALQEGLRPYDLVVRWGGDEFLCGLAGVTSTQAEDRFASIEEALRPVTAVSVGLVQLGADEELDRAIGRADRAMYDSRR